MGLANFLGRFVALEKDFHLIFDKRMERVLFELDVSKGLLANIDIVCGEHIINQRLDYLHMSFRCNYFHDIGHLRKKCSLLLQGKTFSWGVDQDSLPTSPSPDGISPFIECYSPSMDYLYVSTSPTPYEGISKGELLFIEDVETWSRLS